EVLAVEPEARGAGDGTDIVNASVATALEGRAVEGVEVRLADPAHRSLRFLFTAGPLFAAGQECIGLVVTLIDITWIKRAEEQQRVLLAELSHRVKNNLAVVQSVARQTLAGSGSLGDFDVAFSGRLNALALAHGLLTSSGWGQIDLRELVERVVSPYRSLGR